jgi:hypothetical protein
MYNPPNPITPLRDIVKPNHQSGLSQNGQTRDTKFSLKKLSWLKPSPIPQNIEQPR